MKKELLLGLGLAAGVAGFAQEWVAPETKMMEKGDEAKKEIVMHQDSTRKQVADTISRYDVTWWEWIWIEPDPVDWWEWSWIEPDPELNPEWWEDWEWKAWDEGQQEPIKKSRISTHWMVWVWTGISGDFWEITSDEATLTAVLDVTDQNTWFWVMAIRLDDFNSDPEHPVSKVTVLSPHWKKKFWEDWKFWINVELKKTFFDNNPSFNWIYPDVVLSYSADWWRTFEWMYAHRFMNWPDSDAFRLSISKRINDVLNLTWQFRYETWYDRNFYGRVTADVDLWNGFLAQISWIAKYWKITPTICIIRRF